MFIFEINFSSVMRSQSYHGGVAAVMTTNDPNNWALTSNESNSSDNECTVLS